ncbi:MAG TPA: polynucleotide adenylyltransferase PcnB [Gammaproteobacteria bacterium]
MTHTDPPSRSGPTIVPRAEHGISRQNISENSLKVLYRLKNAGFAGFLVGGGVRDLLLGRHPKDFDVVTDAHPEQIKQLFRNARLIGRRFRLAHVRFGRDIVEVATFRAATNDDPDNGADDRVHSESGRILRDNVYGTIEEDIWRRDFTVNALYYNIADFSVWDFTTGFEDIRTRTLRLIGDPERRYREDPVRMLRAVRFAAKLGFTIAPDTAEPILALSAHIRDVPAARLFEEVLKLFQAGHGLRSFELLEQYHLVGHLFPSTAAVLAGEQGGHARALIRAGLANTDRRVAEDKPITPTFLYAVLLWPAIKALTAELLPQTGGNEHDAMAEACHRIVHEQAVRTSLPKRFSAPMVEMLMLQRRFEQRHGIRGARLLEHKRFRAAYDFLVLRVACGEAPQELADWWTEVQRLSPDQQRDSFGPADDRRPRRRRRRRRPRGNAVG